MAKSPLIRRSSPFDSIREAGSCNVLPDANENEKFRKEVINIDALRTLSRIVLAIQPRIDAGNNQRAGAEPCDAGTSGGPKITGANSGQDTNRGETAGR